MEILWQWSFILTLVTVVVLERTSTMITAALETTASLENQNRNYNHNDHSSNNKNENNNNSNNNNINIGNKWHPYDSISSYDDSNDQNADNLLKQKHGKSENNADEKIHSRKKRLIWITDDGRLALPPGTVLSITPTISMPLVRHPLEGFLSNLTMSFPLTIDFDKLGLTDNENPLGVLPPLFARSMGRAAGTYLADYVGDYLMSRKTRSTSESGDQYISFNKGEPQTKITDAYKNAFHGGERAILYGVAEDLISTFGLNGKACLLRIICEIHSKSLDHLGLFGEILKLFFTATKSNYAELLNEYVTAQKVGQGTHGPGECYPYYKECPKSLFKSETHKKYSETPDDHENSEEDIEDIIQLNHIENELEADSGQKRTHQLFNM